MLIQIVDSRMGRIVFFIGVIGLKKLTIFSLKGFA
jgi:hypothetical protein